MPLIALSFYFLIKKKSNLFFWSLKLRVSSILLIKISKISYLVSEIPKRGNNFIPLTMGLVRFWSLKYGVSSILVT